MIKNIIVSAIIGALVASGVLLIAGVVGGNNQPLEFGATGTRFPSGVSVGTTTSPALGQFLANATTTIPCSYDGSVAQANFTTSATGTAKASLTNTCGAALMCQGGNAYFDSPTSFTSSIVLAIGTSTSATGYATGLMSSTTIATTSDTALNVYSGNPFILPIGNSIVGALSDYNTTGASSTYYGNWDAEIGFNCRLMGS